MDRPTSSNPLHKIVDLLYENVETLAILDSEQIFSLTSYTNRTVLIEQGYGRRPGLSLKILSLKSKVRTALHDVCQHQLGRQQHQQQ